MEVVITVDDIRTTHSLYRRLLDERELRGRVRLTESPPIAGTLGTAELIILLAVAIGGIARPAAQVLIAWIRRDPGAQTVTLTRPDGATFTVHSRHIRGVDDAGVQQVVNALAAHLDNGDHHDAERSDG